MVVIGLGKNLLFKSVLAHCVYLLAKNVKASYYQTYGIYEPFFKLHMYNDFPTKANVYATTVIEFEVCKSNKKLFTENSTEVLCNTWPCITLRALLEPLTNYVDKFLTFF